MTEDAITYWVFKASDWLATNALTLAQVLAALVTAVATYALWRATRVLAVETTILAKMTAQPFVICWLESSGASPLALNLTIRNTGNATAFDVKVRISPALPNSSGSPAVEESETTLEASLLPPGQLLTIEGVLGRDVHEKVFSAKVKWATRPGSCETETLEYNFEAKDGFRGGWNTKGAHHIAEELEKIRKKLDKASQARGIV